MGADPHAPNALRRASSLAVQVCASRESAVVRMLSCAHVCVLSVLDSCCRSRSYDSIGWTSSSPATDPQVVAADANALSGSVFSWPVAKVPLPWMKAAAATSRRSPLTVISREGDASHPPRASSPISGMAGLCCCCC